MTPTPDDPMATALYPHRRDEAAHAATMELTPTRGSGSVAGSLAPREAVVAELAPSFSAATDRLRQGRLRAAALYFSLWWGVILAQGLIGGGSWIWPAVVTTGLIAAFALLSRRAPIPPPGLRAVELAIFGLMAAAFVRLQYDIMLAEAARGNAIAFRLATKNAVINATTLMFAYAMLIPNSWRTAAWVVLGLAAYPFATNGALFRAHPEVLRFAGGQGEYEMPGMNLTVTLVAATLSLYGTHVLSTLRQEVFEARRLNQYQLGDRLGTGGMGEVYRAEHRLLKRPCAIKLIRPEAAGDPATLKRFEREVRAVARLSHPNVVEIYDYGHTEDRTFYCVMEYLRGLNLDELVARDGPLPAGRVIYLLGQACAGLGEAHVAGLIHRDLKPANLFAARVGRRCDEVKLLDFGLVKEVAGGPVEPGTDGTTDGTPPAPSVEPSVELSQAGTVRGTPQYMAPEQATADPALDHRCDLYALGAVAYFLLTGRPPFEGKGVARVMMAHVQEPVVPPSHHRPDVPEDLERVVLRCLAKDPADRYPDAEGLHAALASCAAAGQWDARQAARWWQAGIEQGIEPAPSHGL